LYLKIINNIPADMKWTASRFWTSGTNLNCKSVYIWCSVNKTLYTGTPWRSGQPDNARNTEWTAEIRFDTGADSETTLNDISNNTLYQPICEVSFI
jgi:hypothetical protein